MNKDQQVGLEPLAARPTGTNPGRNPSTINDFNGFIGVANIELRGTGTDTSARVI